MTTSSGKEQKLGNLYILNYLFLIRKVGDWTNNGGVGTENFMLKNLLKGMKDIKKGQRFLREEINLEVKH